MNKKYIVRLTAQERDELTVVIKKLKGTSERVRRAHILLKADADGPNWTDRRIAEAFGCRTQTVENIRQRLVERGFREALDRRRLDLDVPVHEKHVAGRCSAETDIASDAAADVLLEPLDPDPCVARPQPVGRSIRAGDVDDEDGLTGALRGLECGEHPWEEVAFVVADDNDGDIPGKRGAGRAHCRGVRTARSHTRRC